MSSTSRSHQVHAAVSTQCRPKFGHWYYKTESALADFKCKGKPVRSLLVVVPYRRLQDLYAWGLQQHHGPPPSDQDNTVRETPTSCCWGQERHGQKASVDGTQPARPYTRRCSRLQLTLCCLSYVAIVWPVAPVVGPFVCKLGYALCSTGWFVPHTAEGPCALRL